MSVAASWADAVRSTAMLITATMAAVARGHRDFMCLLLGWTIRAPGSELVWPAHDGGSVRPRAARAVRPGGASYGRAGTVIGPVPIHGRPAGHGGAVRTDAARPVDSAGARNRARLVRHGQH